MTLLGDTVMERKGFVEYVVDRLNWIFVHAVVLVLLVLALLVFGALSLVVLFPGYGR